MNWDELLNPLKTTAIDELLEARPERIDCGELVEVDGVYVPAE